MKSALLTKAYWTPNRISILVPWLMPLVVSLGIGFFNILLAFIAFLMLSLISRIVVVKRSPFAGLFKEDFEERLNEKEITLENGLILKREDIKKTKRFLRLSKVVALIPSFILMPLFKDLPDMLVGWLFLMTWFFLSQAFFKTYLIAKDLPLDGFPFFRSSNNSLESRSLRFPEPYDPCTLPVSNIRHPMNPLNPGNIGNPANPNYIFK